jgi:hypothetical protein
LRLSYAKVKEPKVVIAILNNRKLIATKSLAADFTPLSGFEKVATEWRVYLAGVDNFEEMTDWLGRH